MRTGAGMNSHNHPMLGSVGARLYEALAQLADQAHTLQHQEQRFTVPFAKGHSAHEPPRARPARSRRYLRKIPFGSMA